MSARLWSVRWYAYGFVHLTRPMPRRSADWLAETFASLGVPAVVLPSWVVENRRAL